MKAMTSRSPPKEDLKMRTDKKEFITITKKGAEDHVTNK
jgi:hypothetical protein